MNFSQTNAQKIGKCHRFKDVGTVFQNKGELGHTSRPNGSLHLLLVILVRGKVEDRSDGSDVPLLFKVDQRIDLELDMAFKRFAFCEAKR